jgi:hypothetical protein
MLTGQLKLYTAWASFLWNKTRYLEAGVRYNEAKGLYVALGDDLQAFRSEMESMRGVVLYYGASEELLSQSRLGSFGHTVLRCPL